MRAFAPSLTFAFAAALAVVLAGCGSESRDDSASPGAPADTGPASAARDVPPDTSRAGPAFLAVYKDGPLSELRVVRATNGALVVAGAADFPAGTKVTVGLLARTSAGALEPVASARATVDLGHFMSAPLLPSSGPPPPGIQVIKVTAGFGPEDQDPAVLRAADDGRRFRGSGVQQRTDGRIVFDTTLEVPL